MVWIRLGLIKQRLQWLQLTKLHRPHLTKRHYLIAGGVVLLAAALASSAVAKWAQTPSRSRNARESTWFWIRPCPPTRDRGTTSGPPSRSRW